MTDDLKSALVTSVETAAAQAGLILLSAAQGADFHGRPTALFQLGLPEPPVWSTQHSTVKLDVFNALE